MEIIYDEEIKQYLVSLDDSEKTTFINTDDVVEAREEFLKRMTWMFNDTIREKLKG